MDSKDLLKLLIAETKLSPHLLERELKEVITELGMKREELDLEQIRLLMKVYLEETLLRVQETPASEG